MYSLDIIRKNYANYNDNEIVKIAKDEPHGLRPEVIEILKAEIHSRNLDSTLIKWIDADLNRFVEFEKTALKSRIGLMTCSNCDSSNGLIGVEINQVVSGFIFCTQTRKELIVCATCARKKKRKSRLATATLGWWSGNGWIITPIVLLQEILKSFRMDKISDRILNDFIEQNTRAIRLGNNTDHVIRKIIQQHNKLQDEE